MSDETVFVTRPTKRASVAEGLFKVGPTQGRSPDTPRSRQHSPKKRRLRRQTIKLAPPRRIKTGGGDEPPRLEECQSWPRNANGWPPRHPRQAASADYGI